MIGPDLSDPGIALFVVGRPMAQPRAKAVNRGTRAGVYTPATAYGWKTQVALAVRGLDRRESGTIIRLSFHFERPQGHYGVKGLRASAPVLHEQKPDPDNLGKAVLDAMVDAGFLKDDKIVVGLFITKEWSTRSGCEVIVRKATRRQA